MQERGDIINNITAGAGFLVGGLAGGVEDLGGDVVNATHHLFNATKSAGAAFHTGFDNGENGFQNTTASTTQTAATSFQTAFDNPPTLFADGTQFADGTFVQ